MSKLKRELARIARQIRTGRLKPPRRDRKRPPPPPPPRPAEAPARTQTDALIACALQVGREEGFEAALPLWQLLHDRRASGAIPKVTVVPADGGAARETPFERVVPAAGAVPEPRFCIYTTLFGPGDTLSPPMGGTGDIPLICFTDQDIDVPGWRIERVASDGPPLVQAKRFKVLPHLCLPGYDASLYIDANRLLHGDIPGFVRRWLAHERFVAWPHPSRNDAYAEAEAVLILDKHDPAPVVAQVARYRREGLPDDTGLIEANFLWRRHGDPDVRRLMEAWWSEMEATGSWRDQISLAFLTWKLSVRPKVLPPEAGVSRHSGVSTVMPHIRALPRPARAPARPRSVAFLYNARHAESGSTVMRARQLAEIARSHLGDRYDFVCTADPLALRDAIVILNKSALARMTPAEIYRLGRTNAALVGDFVDDPVSIDKAPLMDVLLASSIHGFIRIQAAFPNIATVYVPHHVDRRLPRDVAQKGRFSIGYFGEPKNAVRSGDIAGLVDFVHVDTSRQDMRWMTRLADHSMHYHVRPYLDERGFKPFLKGFTAAHCGAVVIAPRDEHDALHYLGDDYPFLLSSRKEEEIVTTLAVARDSFGGPEWRRARDVMAFIRDQVSDERVAGHLGRALALVG